MSDKTVSVNGCGYNKLRKHGVSSFIKQVRWTNWNHHSVVYRLGNV